MPSTILCIRSRGISEDVRIDSSKQFTDSKLYSNFGSISAKGSDAEKLVFKNATAYRDIKINHAVIEGAVLSKFGKVFAAHSVLGDVSGYSNVKLIDSSAKSVSSEFGRITIKQLPETDSKISNVEAYRTVKLGDVSVEGKVVSQFGSIVAKQSHLNDVAAYRDIALINSSAKQIKSEFGAVKVEQSGVTESQSTLEKVTACYDIHVTNSSAKELSSEFGKVSIKQADGTRRSITQISGQGTVIAQGSIVDEITLHVSQDEKGLLDLTDTEVLGKIVVKISDIVIFHSLGAFFSWFFFGEPENKETAPKHFSLLIRGTEMPKNISFEGFETDELTSQSTDEGLLVTGQKKK